MFKINEVLKATGGKLLQNGSFSEVSGISIDSREMNSGECFVALRGAHYNGRDFIKEAVSKGASMVITSDKVNIPEGIACVLVNDPVRALGDLAAFWRSRFDVPCVGITGSNGKSTTKQMVAAALSSMGPVLNTEGNFNNLIGLPLTVLRWRDEHEVAVLEMGMNASGEIARLTKISRPDVGVITNVSPAHLEFLHNVENVAKAKGELFDNMRENSTVVVNLEDPWVRKLAKTFKGKVYTFGMQNEADVRFGRMESRGLESIDMTVYIKGREYGIHLSVPGTHNVMNSMAAIAVAMVLGVSPEKAISGIEKFEPMSMRMERVQLSSGVQIINDSYNANPLSVKEALRTVSKAARAGRFVVVFGDMLELGENASNSHMDVGVTAAQYNSDRIFAFGDYAKYIVEGAKKAGMNSEQLEVYSDMEELKRDVLSFVKTGDIVLIKGSRGMQMERVAEYLKDKIGVD